MPQVYRTVHTHKRAHVRVYKVYTETNLWFFFFLHPDSWKNEQIKQQEGR